MQLMFGVGRSALRIRVRSVTVVLLVLALAGAAGATGCLNGGAGSSSPEFYTDTDDGKQKLESALVRASSKWYEGTVVDLDDIPSELRAEWLTVMADDFGVSESSLAIVYAERGDWSDTCIGRGGLCGQAITSGWRVLVADSYGVLHWLHDGGSEPFTWP